AHDLCSRRLIATFLDVRRKVRIGGCSTLAKLGETLACLLAIAQALERQPVDLLLGIRATACGPLVDAKMAVSPLGPLLCALPVHRRSGLDRSLDVLFERGRAIPLQH